MNSPDAKEKAPGMGLVGVLTIWLLGVAGLASYAGFGAIAKDEFVAAGVCLIAAALPLGFLVNAMLKK